MMPCFTIQKCCTRYPITFAFLGTIIKNQNGQVIGDLDREGLMFVAARGGAGGRGNKFFLTDTEQVTISMLMAKLIKN